MISSRSRTKDLDSLVIDDQRGPNQWLRADARESDRVQRILRTELANGIEGSTARWSAPNDSTCFDL